MKLARCLLPIVALLSLSAVRQDEPTYTFVWKPTLGQKLNFEMRMKGAGQDGKFELTGDVELKVTFVDTNGDYTLESLRKGGKIVTNDESEDLPDDEKPSVEKFSAQGVKIKPPKPADEDEEEPEGFLGSLLNGIEFNPPEKPMKKGDKWTHKIAKDEENDVEAAEIAYEVKGEETLNDTKVVTVTFTYRETEAENPTTGTGSFSFEAKDFEPFRSEGTLKIPGENGKEPGTMQIEFKRKAP